MKNLFNIFNGCSVVTKAFMRVFFVLGICLILCSAAFFFFAEHSYSYYAARQLSLELIEVLRSGSTIIAAGTVISAYIEKQSSITSS
ncbi:MAG: hypothetical protein IJA02_11835 [Clostridia bacterium]|nr:hypothetical protein [Clostridia bacterium]